MRCKVVCNAKVPYEDSVYLYFSVVYTGSEENKQFFKYTPGGQINLNVVSKATCDKYEVGKEYYIDFIPA